ncbi:MAG: dNTP triphosphohydrolase [Verrucomicrobiales bacterium]|nr:dNTP triphosphohydrolase [Verrucomicrobiales bacterium]
MENTFYQPFDFDRIDGELPANDGEYRTGFQVDRDRIIHTSAFRRLQSKTQVFFSGEYDFYRTRLTHSIEVAQIGRSICNRLNQTSPLLKPGFGIDADLVEASCLAHDIGHPPFGHTGERTLHRLMAPYGGFEGNAQTLRILTSILFGPDRGMNPTRGFLDGVLKYKTLYGEVADQKNHFLYREQGEALDFVTDGTAFPESLPAGKTRNGFRSVECQVMDWADDTAYSLNDIADGIHAGFITVEKIERWAEGRELDSDQEAQVKELLKAIRKNRVEPTIGKKIGAFIAGASLEEVSGFLSDSTNRHRYRVVIDSEIEKACSLYKAISLDLVFRSQQLQQLDRKSDFILTRLFEVFVEQYVTSDQPRFKLLSDDEERLLRDQPDETARARVICDVVAKMTDGIATRTYKRLFDADFGSIVDLV